MLAHVGGDERLAVGGLVERLHHLLRLHRAVFVDLVTQPVHLAPAVDFLPPALHALVVRAAVVLVDHGEHLFQHLLHRPDDGNVSGDVLGDAGRVDIDMDDLGARAELLGVVGDPVVQARAGGQNHVGVVHRHVGFVGAVHTEHAEELLVGARIGAQPHQRVGDRIVELAGHRGERLAGVPLNHAAAGVDHRALGLEQLVHRLANLPGVPPGDRHVGAHLDLLRVLVREGLVGRRVVLGNIDQNRAGTAGAGDVEGLFDHLRDLTGVANHEAVLHDRPRQTDHVGLLEGVVADPVGAHLAGQHHHGNGVHEGGGNAGDGIGRAGAGGHQHHAGLAGGAGIAVRGMRGGLLVAHQNVIDFVLLEQRVIDVQYRAPGIPEDVLHSLVLQSADHHFRAG